MQKKKADRLSLAFRDIQDVHPRLVEKYARVVVDLDLSNNRISNIDPLVHFTKMETLVLDKNMLSSHTKFPRLPALRTLWVNYNNITNLAIFIDKLVESVPSLTYLSMLGNEACPNFLNNGTLAQYQDYRKYIINRLRNLSQLDSDPISMQEREEAVNLYGNTPVSVAVDDAKQEEEAKEKEKQEQEEEEAKEKRRKLILKKKRLRKQQLEKKRQKKKEEEQLPEQEPLPFTLADILPEVDESTGVPVNGPLLVADIHGEPPLPNLEEIAELTDEEDWSDDVDDSLFDPSDLMASTLTLSTDSEGWD